MKPNNRNLGQIITTTAVIIFGFAAIFFLSNFLEKNRFALSENYADEDLALQGANLKGFALGFEGLIADWYWMQSLQYLGTKLIQTPQANISIDNLDALNPRLLYPYLDNATTLDPDFNSVYEFGATVLPAVNSEQAIKLLKKGIADHPENWRLYQHLGYIYWRLKDFEKASAFYSAGAKLPDAPKFMEIMAVRTKTEGGSRDTAREIYREIYKETEDEQVKKNAEYRLAELDSLDEREAIQKFLAEFQSKNNRCANDWREILPILQTVKLPAGESFHLDKSNKVVDPTGAPYVLDKENCQVKLDSEKTKLPLK